MDVSEGNTQAEEANYFPLESLPEVAMVHLFSFLSNNDRFTLSQTSSHFNSVFHHPSVWKRMHVDLLDEASLYDSIQHMKPLVLLANMARRVGSYLHHLTLRFRGHLRRPSEECVEVIKTLFANSRIRTLILEVSQLPPKNRAALEPRLHCLQPVLDLLSSAPLLASVSIRRWPGASSAAADVLRALKENKSQTLKELAVFYEHPAESGWTPLNQSLPPTADLRSTVLHLPQLRVLSLRMLNADDDLIASLTELSCLHTLRLMVEAPRRQDGSRKLVSISQDAWKFLLKKKPNLKVEFSANGSIPAECLSLALQPAAQISCFAFMQHARVSTPTLHAIADTYCDSLQQFYDYTNTKDLDESFVYLVEKCRRLTHFLTHSYVCGDTLLKLAEAGRGARLQMLSVVAENILVHATPDVPEEGDEQVIKQRADGTLYYAWQDAVESDACRQQTLTTLRQRVSELLGRAWRPYGCKEDGTIEQTELGRVMRGVRLVNPQTLDAAASA